MMMITLLVVVLTHFLMKGRLRFQCCKGTQNEQNTAVVGNLSASQLVQL